MAAVALLVLLGVCLFYLVIKYNQLIRQKNQVTNAFSQIDVQLTRRHELIPNLVETAKGFLKHERQTLEAVIQARNSAHNILQSLHQSPKALGQMDQLNGAESLLSQSLGRLMAVVESYPELKSDRTMLQLMEELASTENRVGFARQAFNDAVMTYNTSQEQFPVNLFATPLGFKIAKPFEIQNEEAKQVPKVSFG